MKTNAIHGLIGVALLLSGGSALGGCGSCNADKDKPAGTAASSSVAPRAVTSSPPVMQSTGAIMTDIAKAGHHVDNLMVIRSDTTLKLSGTAKTEADKKGAEDVARASPGITAVVNNIVVAP